MLSVDELLVPLTEMRAADDVIVTTMSVVRPWGRLSDSDLDFASADSAMAHAADLALGIALAQPERRVVCLNGDGSMLMSLGTLATVTAAGAPNLRLVIVDNRSYEITGGQPIPGAGRVDFAALARAAGFPTGWAVETSVDYRELLPRFLHDAPGPGLLSVRVTPGCEGPISRGPAEDARYLQASLYDWARVMRSALTGSDATASP